MSTIAKLMGSWQADLETWQALDPKVADLGDMAEMVFANFKVDLSQTALVVDAGKGRPKEYAYTVRQDGASQVVLDVIRKDQSGVFEIEVVDDDHMILRLTEPKEDVMALKRG